MWNEDKHSPTSLSLHQGAFVFSDEIARHIETLRQLILEIEELKADRFQFGWLLAPSGSDEGSLLPDEMAQFHARKQIVSAERHIRKSIREIFGAHSPEFRKHQYLRINAATPAGIDDTIAIIESLIFQLEERRLAGVEDTHRHSDLNAHIDPLTDLYTAQLLSRHLTQELARSKRYDYTLALVVLTLQNCRKLARAGRAVHSEAVLVNMACACKASIRGHDSAYRISEHEFAVLLPQSDPQGAYAVFQRIADKFAQAGKRLSADTDVTLEFGMATFPFDGDTPTTLFNAAVTHRRLSKAGTKEN
jgi:diguanylate cyclase (GGDEF)-like protein